MGKDETNIRKRKSLYELPSRDEQIHLRNTEDLMRTNLLKLQVNEILNEVSVSKTVSKLSGWLNTFTSFLKNISVDHGIGQSWIETNSLPFELECYDRKPVLLDFIPISSVHEIGSHPLGTSTKPFLNVDIAFTIPDNCLENRDILNHIYFDKRKLYLAVIAHHLKEKPDLVLSHSIRISFLKGDPNKPIIILKPAISTKYFIRLIPVISTTVFTLNRLEPRKNNIRPKSWIESLKQVAESRDYEGKASPPDRDPSTLSPTPLYNAAILEEMAILPHHLVLRELVENETYKQAIILLKVWLTQMRMRVGLDCVDGHTGAMVLVFLHQTRRVSPQMPPLHVFQALLKLFIETDFSKHNLDFSGEFRDKSDEDPPVVLLHPLGSSNYNLLWRCSQSSMRRLAELSKAALDHILEGNLTPVFLKRRTFYEDFDVYCKLPLSSVQLKEVGEGQEALRSHRCVGGTYSSWVTASRGICGTLSYGLGDRAIVFTSPLPYDDIAATAADPSTELQSAHFPECPLHADLSSINQTTATWSWSVIVGFRLSQEEKVNARHVDRAPAEPEALDRFRSLWGPLVELRRFKDGTIVESVVWPLRYNGPQLVEHVTRYLLNQHALEQDHYSKTSSHTLANDILFRSTHRLASLLPQPVARKQLDGGSTSDPGDANDLCRNAIRTLDKLRSLMISGDLDLPLSVEGLSPCCPELRYTTLSPPMVHPVIEGSKGILRAHAEERITRLLRALPVFVLLTKSSAWPDEYEAMRCTKIAMMIRICEKLKEKYQINAVARTLPDSSHGVCADVLYGGYVYRLLLKVDTEVPQSDKLLRFLRPSYRDIYSDEISSDIAHHTTIHGICARYPAFASTVRLLSLWLACHCFSGHMSVESVELLVASVFISSAVTSPYLGFIRSLQLLADHEWGEAPLIVDFGLIHENGSKSTNNASKMSSEDANVTETNMKMYRTNHPHHQKYAMYIVSSLDRKSREIMHKDSGKTQVIAEYPVSGFTCERPEKVVLSKIITCAKASLNTLLQWAACGPDNLLEEVFLAHDFSHTWNVVLSLQPSLRCKPVIGSFLDDIASAAFEAERRGPSAANMTIFSNLAEAECMGRNMVSESSCYHPHALQARYVHQLRAKFGHLALIFWNHLAGDSVGIVWRPNKFLPSKFSVRDVRHKTPTVFAGGSEPCSVLDVSNVMAEIVSLGDGIVQEIIYR